MMEWLWDAFLLIKAHQIKTTRNVPVIRTRFINLLQHTMGKYRELGAGWGLFLGLACPE